MSYQVSEKITQLPPVPNSQNGTDTAHSLRTLYDPLGRVTWAKSPRGFLTHFQYDDLTGALVRRIDDVNTAILANPSGWLTPGGGGTHLISDFKVDAHGRVLRSLGPQHAVQLRPDDTFTTPVRRAEFHLYRDVMNEEWSASGYEQIRDGILSRHVVGPVLRIVRDPAGRVTDEILVARSSDSWAPTLAEMNDRSTWCGWKRYTFDVWGRLLTSRVYHTIPVSGDGAPTAETGTGASIAITGHYDETEYGYDYRGRQNRVKEATGTITRTVFDVRGLVLETWVGTNDSGATDNAPGGGGASGNNMVRVSLREYDGNAAGKNGNLTKVTAFADGSSANERVSTFEYDYRDRLTHSRAQEATGENFLTQRTLDGLGRATSVYRYREEPSLTQPLLISRVDSFFDTRGRTYREETRGADPVTGAVTAAALVAERWFDAAGNVIKSGAPGSEAREKVVFDGLERGIARYIVLEAAAAGSGSTTGEGPGDGGESGGVPEDPVSSSSWEAEMSSASSESADAPGPADGKDPADPAWPFYQPSSSDDHTIQIINNFDVIRGVPGMMAVMIAEKTCPNCCEQSGEGATPGVTVETPGVDTGGTCGETSDGEAGPCPVHYGSGQKCMEATDIAVNAGGFSWGHTRVTNNRVSNATGGPHGHGVTIRQQPSIQSHPSGRISVQSGGVRNVWFEPTAPGAATLKPSFGGNRARLIANPAASELHFYNRSGAKNIFHDQSHPATALRGKLKSIVNRAGQTLQLNYNPNGVPVNVVIPAAGGGRQIKFTYDYYPNTPETEGGNAGRIKMVVVDSGTTDAPEERRRVRYEYYSPSSPHGADGDLRLVSHEEWDGSRWLSVRCEYYRYYTLSHQDSDGRRGQPHLLKYSVSAAGCDALGDPSSYDSRTDAEILAVSSYFFEYDTDSRVKREFMNGGKLLHVFSYQQSALNPGFTGHYDPADTSSPFNTNVWHMCTTETVKDLRNASAPRFISKNTVYTNLMGKVIVSHFEELDAVSGNGTGRAWVHHNVFDSEGRFTRRVKPAAVLSFTHPGLSDHITVSLRTTGAAILDLVHYPPADAAEGLIKNEIIRNGDSDTAGFVARLFEYGAHAIGGVTIYPLVREVQYAQAGSITGAIQSHTRFFYHGMPNSYWVGTLPSAGSDVDNSTANIVTSDTVFQQEKHQFDRGGNLIFTRSYQRYHTANAKGELSGPTGASPRARRSYAAFYPDAMGRAQLTADFGTNGGVPMLRPEICPGSSHPDIAVIKTTLTSYNNRGEAFQFTDPAGTVTKWTNDCAGRRTQLIENVRPLTPTPGPDANRTTSFTYGKGGLLRFMDIVNADTGNQRTEWIYGTSLFNATTNPAGSLIATSHLLSAKKYATDTGGYLQWRYNRLGEVMEQKDANGTTRSFTRDKLGRLTADTVEAFASGVDAAVRKLGRSYNRQGRLKTATSYDNLDAVLNEAGFTYSPYGQLAGDYQSHSGAVDFGSSSTTPAVQYTYENADMNLLRLWRITYPSGRQLWVNYFAAGTNDYRLSRVHQLQFADEMDPVVRYQYAGLSWIVEAAYPEPNLQMSHHNGGTAATGSGGDPYTGIDRFGRLEEVRWHYTGSDDVEHLLYGYDKADNRRWKDNPLVPGTSPQQDELYNYDGLYQVTRRRRGSLSSDHASVTGVQRQEDFTFDPLGNWKHYELAINGTPDTSHDRTHNKSNQLTGITGTSSGLIAHDANGNMTKTVPDKDGDWTKGYTCQWDAWNRLVEVRTSDTASTLVAQYQYDALFRRTIRTANGQTHHEYWDAAWRLIEERVSSATSAFSPYTSSFLWGLQRRNDLILRDRQDTPPGSGSSSSASEPLRHYLAYDWINPTAILSRTGAVLARQVFSAFGIRAVVGPDWSESFTVPTELEDWNFGFHGQFTDAETGWANYGFRYYPVNLGRWAARDKILEMGGINFYQSLRNSPLLFQDYYGAFPGAALPIPDEEFPTIVPGGTVLPRELGGAFVPNGEPIDKYLPKPPPPPLPPPAETHPFADFWDWLTSPGELFPEEYMPLPMGPPPGGFGGVLDPKRQEEQAIQVGNAICDTYPLPAPDCCRSGAMIKDDYTERAKKICKDFMKIYKGSVFVRRVASDLIDKEKGCQKLKNCDERNACRFWAHVYAYAHAPFPHPFFGQNENGYPAMTPDSAEIGWKKLWPDFKKKWYRFGW